MQGTIILQEGILTVIVAFAAYGFIHNYPKTAKFLTEPEREFVQACLTADNDATNHEPFSWPSVLRAVKDPKCWLYGLALSLPLYTLSLFLPTIIKALGYTAVQAQLSVPPYAVATVFTVLVAVASEKAKRRAPFIIGSSVVLLVGTTFSSRPHLTNQASATLAPYSPPLVYTPQPELCSPGLRTTFLDRRSVQRPMRCRSPSGTWGQCLGRSCIDRAQSRDRPWAWVCRRVFAGEYSGGVIWAMLARENKWKLESERSAVVNESPIENDDDVRKFN